MVGRPQHDDVAFVNAAAALWGDESPDIGYQARVFAQTSLPYRDPGSLPVWGRRNGSLSLVVQPGHDVDQDGLPVSAGFPFGVIPRLLLTWISTEAVRTKDPVLPLGDSLSDFMRQLGLVPTGGKVGTITRLREQMRRLFKATIAVRYSEHDPQTGVVRDAGRQSMIAAEYDLWWSSRAPLNSQPTLLPSYLRLTSEFFEEVTTRPVPVSLDALRLLRGSPLRLDIYAWLTYRMSYLQRPTKVAWDGLSLQFGSSHANTRQGRHDFRRDFERHLRYVLAVYPDAKVDVDSSGLLLRPSKTAQFSRMWPSPQGSGGPTGNPGDGFAVVLLGADEGETAVDLEGLAAFVSAVGLDEGVWPAHGPQRRKKCREERRGNFQRARRQPDTADSRPATREPPAMPSLNRKAALLVASIGRMSRPRNGGPGHPPTPCGLGQVRENWAHTHAKIVSSTRRNNAALPALPLNRDGGRSGWRWCRAGRCRRTPPGRTARRRPTSAAGRRVPCCPGPVRVRRLCAAASRRSPPRTAVPSAPPICCDV